MKQSIENRGGARQQERDSNIELCRIVTMLFIIAHHYVVNSGLTLAEGQIFSNLTSWRSIFLILFGAWGKTGINCFVLITGYFMCKSQITLVKFAKLLLEVYFYRLIGYGIFLMAGYETVSISRIVQLILPITSVSDGFTSCYLVFFLCIPFLNVLVHAMTERQYICLAILMILIYCLFGSVPKFSITFNYITWFCILYLFSSYVRLYPKKLFDSVKLWGRLCFAMVFLASLSVVVCLIIPPRFGIAPRPYIFVSDSNKILAVTVAFSGFMFFKNLKVKPNKYINAAASTTFGVLLIHANSDAMRTWLWQDMLNNLGMYSSPYLALHAFGSVIGIFVICSVLDYMRIMFIERPFFSRCWSIVDTELTMLGHRIADRIVSVSNSK